MLPTSWRQAASKGGQGRPAEALAAARRIAEASPNEVVLRVKVAELLEAGGDAEGAARAYLDHAQSQPLATVRKALSTL